MSASKNPARSGNPATPAAAARLQHEDGRNRITWIDWIGGARPVSYTHLDVYKRQTANLAVLDRDLVAYVAQVPSRHRMRMFTEVGRQVLPHASGVGKAILSTLPESKVRSIIQRTGLPRYTPSTITDEAAFFAELRESCLLYTSRCV